MKNVQLAEILQNVAYQAAGHIRISYNEKHNAFELRYLNKQLKEYDYEIGSTEHSHPSSLYIGM